MICQSDKIDLLATSLSKFQGEIKDIKKESDNPFFKSKYADLASILDYVRPILSKNGLSVVQRGAGIDLNGDNCVLSIVTTLMHSSGQYIESLMQSPLAKKPSPQEIGSAMTYCRRYDLAAILGISQVDDDGNEASGNSNKPIDATIDKNKFKTMPFVAKQSKPNIITNNFCNFINEKGECCGKVVDANVQRFSMDLYKKVLCRPHQEIHKQQIQFMDQTKTKKIIDEIKESHFNWENEILDR